MIIDQTTAANRIEYLKHLLELEQITSESNELRIGKLQDTLAIAIEQRDRLKEDLAELEESRDFWKAEAERWREQAGENFQVPAWKKLMEEHRNKMRDYENER